MCTSYLRSLWPTVLLAVLSFTAPGEAMPDPSAIYCTELGYSFEIRTDEHGGTYGVCVFPGGSFCSSWAYFTECYLGEPSGQCHWPCQELGCKQAGQMAYVSECCEGLEKMQPPETYDQDCNPVGIGGPGPICSDCGNGICEPWESKCNCPLDCRKPRVIYVDDDATGANDGSSWADACNYLQDSLADANSSEKPVEIRIAQGVYKPDSNSAVPNGTGNREATFQLINRVNLIGGYAGFGEPDPNARNIGSYETILSGDLSGNDVDVNDPCDLLHAPGRADNSFHVTTARNIDNVVVDGLTITAGHADGSWDDYPNASGAGLYARFSDVKVVDCTFRTNSASIYGGGIHSYSATLTVRGSTFIDNAADRGGGLSSEGNLELADSLFLDNHASLWGGAMVVEGMTAVNVVIAGNKTEEAGGGIYNGWDDATLTNCTISSNVAASGGAIAGSIESDVAIANCILWGNQAQVGSQLSFSDPHYGADIYVSFSDVQGGRDHVHIGEGAELSWQDGNIDIDPQFANSQEDNFHPKSQAGRWDVSSGSWVQDEVTSPCIDAGNPMSPIGPETFPNGGIINMGAYGGTTEASKSYFGKPPCQTIVAGDINGDCVVDFRDFVIMASHWLDDHNA